MSQPSSLTTPTALRELRARKRRYTLDMAGHKDRIIRPDGTVAFELAHGDSWTLPMVYALNGEQQLTVADALEANPPDVNQPEREQGAVAA